MIDGYRWHVVPHQSFADQWEGPGKFLGTGKGASKTPEEWVWFAEALAKEHGGSLPNSAWLQRNGHTGLVTCMRMNKQLFAHVPQTRLTKTLSEHVTDAEFLASEHDGSIPNVWWLLKNGYSGLVFSMRANPEAFSHIGKTILIDHFKTIKEHVLDAEQLAESNGGSVPNAAWLIQNKRHGLLKCVRKHPEAFRHISFSSSIKRLDEHVADAETLAREHGGVLPGSGWLNKNRYQGITASIRRNPEAFKHIPQRVFSRGNSSKLIGIRVNGEIRPVEPRENAEP